MSSEHKQPGIEKDDLKAINDVRDKAWALFGNLLFLTGDSPEVIDFDLSKAQRLNEFSSPFTAELILQAGKELAEVLKGDFFGPASRIAKYGTAVEKKYMQDTCWILSVVIRQFKHLTPDLLVFKEVAHELNDLDGMEKGVLRDLISEAEEKEAKERVEKWIERILQIISIGKQM